MVKFHFLHNEECYNNNIIIIIIIYPLAELNFKHFTYKKLCISLIFSKLEVSNNKILKIRYAQLEYNIT